MRTIRDLLQKLPTTPERGLLTPQAVGESVRSFGANCLTPLPREPLWKKFLEKFDEPIIKILLAAALLSMIVDLFQADRTLGGVGVGLVIVSIILFGRRTQWIPSILFGCAIVLFFVGLFSGHFLVE